VEAVETGKWSGSEDVVRVWRTPQCLRVRKESGEGTSGTALGWREFLVGGGGGRFLAGEADMGSAPWDPAGGDGPVGKCWLRRRRHKALRRDDGVEAIVVHFISQHGLGEPKLPSISQCVDAVCARKVYFVAGILVALVWKGSGKVLEI
jgi:hypothetical protein